MTITPKSPLPRDIEPLNPTDFTPNRFAGKTILMTGAARGIGLATAVRAAREGANVVIADILKKEGMEALATIQKDNGTAIFVHTDVRKDSDNQHMVDEAVKAFGRIDLALNAAGVMDGIAPADLFDMKKHQHQLFAPIHEATNEYWDQCFAVNVTGMFYSMRYELRQMLKQNDGGAIVNIGSIAGLIGLGGTPAYNASKHAVTGLTRNGAIDYAPYGIRINSVNMAATATPMTDQAYKKVMEMEGTKAANPNSVKVPNTSMAKTLSLLGISDSKNRMSTPAEQAAVILFLLSNDASNITGATWATDGGWTSF
jgi:NAD(P)-dependent dehydrogenase (short-subunit alcohol dehydrogenase family)